nr:MAG TPA: hypothetical protein [Caudoviricetes sp.]
MTILGMRAREWASAPTARTDLQRSFLKEVN